MSLRAISRFLRWLIKSPEVASTETGSAIFLPARADVRYSTMANRSFGVVAHFRIAFDEGLGVFEKGMGDDPV